VKSRGVRTADRTVWLDRLGAVLIAMLALVPAGWTADYLGITFDAPFKGRTDLWVALFGLATWLSFIGSLVVLAVAVGLWKRHIIGRALGFATAGSIGLWALAEAARLVPADPVGLADEVRGRVAVGSVAVSAAVSAGLSLASSALPVVQTLRERWANRVTFWRR
jgi:hypothetical protein